MLPKSILDNIIMLVKFAVQWMDLEVCECKTDGTTAV